MAGVACVKRIILLLALVLPALLLSSCALTPAPERALDRMLAKLAAGDVKAAGKHTLDGALNIDHSDRRAAKIYKPLFRSIRYTVNSSQTDGDYAAVRVTVTVVDMEALLAEASLEMMQNILGGNSPAWSFGNEKYYGLVAGKLEEGAYESITFDVTAYMVRSEGAWKVDMAGSGDFADAIAGGYGEILGY